MIVVERLPTSEPAPGSSADPVVLTWEARTKTRQRLTTRADRDVAIKLPTGTRLPPGTVLFLGDGFHIEVVAAEEDVWLVRAPDAPTLVRVAYEIGNRHFPIEIGDGWVAVRYDHTLAELWERLGVAEERVTRPFLSDQRSSHHH
ncbi:MAG: urease accessory protein UreE [Nitrospirota bacterium]|jgi:urease accessory protein